MPSVTRLGDTCTGHDCFPPRANSQGSPNVFVNGIPAHRQGDSWETHCCTHPKVPHGYHSGILGSGSSTVYVNGKQLGRIGDPVSCGSTVASKFKYSTQLFEMHHLLYTAMLQQSLQDGTYTPAQGKKFLIRERGKPRYITSNAMADKTVNHIICDGILTPTLQKYLIYDNGASQKGKGVDFHRRRFEAHLHKYFMRHGTNDGFIMLGDFSGYYANMPHDKCYDILAHFLTRSVDNPAELSMTLDLLSKIFRTFRVDVSRFSDEHIQAFMAGKIDQTINLNVPHIVLTGEKFLDKGVDIGNQASQNSWKYYIKKRKENTALLPIAKARGIRTESFDNLGVLTAMVYIMTDKASDARSVHPVPSKHYYSVLREGYKAFGFNDKILIEALVEAVRLTNPR